MGYKTPAGTATLTPDEAVTAVLDTIFEEGHALLDSVLDDVDMVLNEVNLGVTQAIIDGDNEALEDYYLLLEGLAEIHEIEAARAAVRTFSMVVKTATKVASGLLVNLV